MGTRKRIAAGNWKMHTTVAEGIALAGTLANRWKGDAQRHMLLAPPFTHLSRLQDALEGSTIGISAQNCHWETRGAFTGEISPTMLQSLGIGTVILGHSERREIFHENNEVVRKKVDAALAAGLQVIFCCGEPLSIREAGRAVHYVESQLLDSLLHLTGDQLRSIVIAYEPIWAIGTGVTATSSQAQEMHAAIREILTVSYSATLAGETTILYGGSVKASNAAELFGQPDVDGGLVGGASLNAEEFLQIASAL